MQDATLARLAHSPPEFDKLAPYATPPESPAAHQPSIAGSAFDYRPRRYSGMEGDNRRQYDQQSYQSMRGNTPFPRMAGSASERSRYSQGQLSSSSSPSSALGVVTGAQHQGLRGYQFSPGAQQYAPQVQEGTLQYSPDFAHDGQRQQQQFQTYPQNIVYGLPAQAQPATEYDPVPQFQQRQSAAIEVLSNQFNVPQYYSAPEPTSVPGAMQMPYPSSSYQTTDQFQQGQQARPDPSTSYVPGILDYSQMTMPNVSDRFPPPREEPVQEDPYAGYLETLRRTFRDTQQGRLVEAGRRILQLSDWVATHVVDLGLTRDEQSLYQQRIEFWNDFNICWLALLQRQKESTQSMIASGRTLAPGQTLLQEDLLERMARELIRMCDGLERHGLVDYQMGVWEEEIMTVLLECLRLLEGEESGGSGTTVPASVPPESGPTG